MSCTLDDPGSSPDWCTAYRRCGLPATVRDGLVEVITDDWTSVLVLPDRLARRVFETTATGPVLVRPRNGVLPPRWRFFTWIDKDPSYEVVYRLIRVGGFIADRGTPIVLPTSLRSRIYWARLPEHDLPALSALIATALDAATRPSGDTER